MNLRVHLIGDKVCVQRHDSSLVVQDLVELERRRLVPAIVEESESLQGGVSVHMLSKHSERLTAEHVVVEIEAGEHAILEQSFRQGLSTSDNTPLTNAVARQVQLRELAIRPQENTQVLCSFSANLVASEIQHPQCLVLQQIIHELPHTFVSHLVLPKVNLTYRGIRTQHSAQVRSVVFLQCVQEGVLYVTNLQIGPAHEQRS
mmetsp:Transcript_3153/g.7107  ORF Transcript_3153/g.7107 Transcript_3153/m.7107 type:complete len:203 (+) Transcript_3153:174-782(+)